MNTDRRGFLGALLALPFLRFGRSLPVQTTNHYKVSPLVQRMKLVPLAPMDYRMSQAWEDYFEHEFARIDSDTRIQVARIYAMSRIIHD